MDKQLLISTGVVKNASGSAYVELGNMKIICSVQGPRDSFRSVDNQDRGALYCDFKYAPFAQKDVYQPNLLNRETKSMSLLLEKILSTSVDLEAFPKAVVELYIMVLEVDGDPLGLSLMCASLALTDAGLNLFGLLGCCCVSVMENNQMIVNPTSDELKKAKCYTQLAILNSTKEIIHISHCGAVDIDICAMCLSKCMEEAARFCGSMRDYLLRVSE